MATVSASDLSKLPPKCRASRATDYEASMFGLRPIRTKLEDDACSQMADMVGPSCVVFGRESKLSPPAERFLLTVMHLGEQAFIVVPFAAFVVALAHSLSLRPYNLIALFSESLMVFFIVFRRAPKTVTCRPLHWAVAFAATAGPLFLRPGAQPFLPTVFGTIPIFGGL